MWQELIVGACVLGAFVFLARRWLPMFSKKDKSCDSGCGGCGTTTPCQTNNTETNDIF